LGTSTTSPLAKLIWSTKRFLASGAEESLSGTGLLEESSLEIAAKPLIEAKTTSTDTICTAK
jgi:hypothetical protein